MSKIIRYCVFFAVLLLINCSSFKEIRIENNVKTFIKSANMIDLEIFHKWHIRPREEYKKNYKGVKFYLMHYHDSSIFNSNRFFYELIVSSENGVIVIANTSNREDSLFCELSVGLKIECDSIKKHLKYLITNFEKLKLSSLKSDYDHVICFKLSHKDRVLYYITNSLSTSNTSNNTINKWHKVDTNWYIKKRENGQ